MARSGYTRITWNGATVRAQATDGARRGLEAAAAELLAASQEIVPYEKGELSRSGASGLVNDTKAAVTYTHPGAVPAHERVNVPPGRGRQRKYLEGPYMSGRQRWATTLAQHIRRELRT